jgi:hypothetical protein
MRSFQQKFSIFTGNTTNLLIQISELNGGRELLTLRDADDIREFTTRLHSPMSRIDHTPIPEQAILR